MIKIILLIFPIFLFCGCIPRWDPLPPTPTPPIPTCEPKTITDNTIDFCDDGDTINAKGGEWYNYASGDAKIPFPKSFIYTPGYGGCSYTIKIGCDLFNSNQNTYVILGTTLSSTKTPIDISGKTGLKFCCKGEQGSYYFPLTMTVRVMISSPSIFPTPGTNNNMYGITFTASTYWTFVQVPFTDFTQESGWGDTVALSSALQNTEAIEWKLVRESEQGKYLYVDEIEFY